MSEQTQSTKVRIFYSYSHNDEDLRIELEKHLSLLQRQHLISSWHDRKITPGEEWKDRIDSNLTSAQLVLLLVSADFLASDYCYDVEMKHALDRHEAGDAVVVPIILRPVDWSTAPFAKLQALPKDAKAVTLWANRDEAFVDIARGIRGLVSKLMTESGPNAEPIQKERDSSASQDARHWHSKPVQSLVQAIRIHEPPDVDQLVTSLQLAFDKRFQNRAAFSELEAFELMLQDVPLQGTDLPIPCAVPRTHGEHISWVTKRLAEKAGLAFGVLFAGSPEILEEATASAVGRRLCILGPQAIAVVVQCPSPVEKLVSMIRKQIGVLRLNPYHVANPAGPNMFFGREDVLLRLTNDLRTHFAVVGPSRIGKSSLISQYRWQMRRSGAVEPFCLNAYGLGDQSADACAREIALAVSASAEANRVKLSTLPKFFRHVATSKHPVDLLIDESDGICHQQVLDYLGEAGKEGSIRLILCGRERLFAYCRSGSSSFGLRLELLKLGPLAPSAARELLTKPTNALGLSFESEDCVEHCLQMAGRMPDLLQFYGRALVDSAVQLQQETITKQMISRIEEHAAISLVGSHVLEIEHDGAASVVLSSLLNSERASLSPSEVVTASDRAGVRLTNRAGVRLTTEKVQEVCEQLFIQGVLAYEGNTVRIANGFLKRQARRLRR